jgi:glycerol-3-phosphate dehydrogenase (NAD(P)+)
MTEKTNGHTKRPRIALIGGGRMARAIAKITGAIGAPTVLWARSDAQRDSLKGELDGSGVAITGDLRAAVEGAELVFIAVPAHALEEVAYLYGDHAKGDHVVIHASRGVGEGFVLPHQMIRRKTCAKKIGVLGGPLRATELTSGVPLAAVVASRYQDTVRAIQALIRGTPIFLHDTKDVIGVEIAGALSNVTQIAAGASDALELGETARGVILTRGLADAKKLGLALGADATTFAGLAGVGDLIPRKVTSTDRHRTLGAHLARGISLEAATRAVQDHVEGILTAKEARKKADALGLDLPLVRAIDDILAQRTAARPAIEAVLKLDIELDPKNAARKPAAD